MSQALVGGEFRRTTADDELRRVESKRSSSGGGGEISIASEQRRQPFWAAHSAEQLGWQSASLNRPKGLGGGVGAAAATRGAQQRTASADGGPNCGDNQRLAGAWTRQTGAGGGGGCSDNSKQATVGGHLPGQLSCPANDACEPMRAPALYRPHQGQAPDFVGRQQQQQRAEAARSKQDQQHWQRQVNYPCCPPLVGAPGKSAVGSGGGGGEQQQVAGAAPGDQLTGMANHGCPALDCDEADDSECSCSNSLDCLASQRPPAAHLHQPGAPALPHPQLSPGLDSPQHLHQHAHQHQHQHQPLRSHHHQHRHQQAIAYQQQQLGQMHAHQHQHRPLQDQDECSFIESPQHPHQHNNHNNHHNHNTNNSRQHRRPHQAQTFHQPLMTNSSAGTLSGSPPRQAVPVAPSAAPLVARQAVATYTATADTITDSSLMGAPVALTPPQQQQQPHQVAGSASDFSSPANEQWRQHQLVGQYRDLQPAQHQRAALKLHATSSGGGANGASAAAAAKQRQAVSFRRSNTSVAGDQQQQQHRQRAQTLSRNSHLEAALQAPATAPGQAMMVAGGGGESGTAARGNKSGGALTASAEGQQLSSGADLAACPSSPAAGAPTNGPHRSQQQQQHLPGIGLPYPSPVTPLSIATATAGAKTTRGLSLRGSHLLASQQLNGSFTLPPITSHRTNSPWMRISSIVLAPLGMLIVLFIVVSPLLHSKNKF